jgi:hypothetical protein
MLSQPTSKRFLEAVQHTLRSGVAPAVSSRDPVASRDAVVMLQAIDAILSSVNRRMGNEQQWMHDEIAQIESVASAIIAAGEDRDGAIGADLEALRANKSSADRLEDTEADYARASELFAKCLERSLVAGGALRKQAETALEARLERENFIRGIFKTVGKD